MNEYKTCKDCYHYEACKTMLEGIGFVVDGDGEDAEKLCKEFVAAADVVEVVRCGECKHYEIHKPSVTLNCEREGKLIPMMPSDFCSYGERRSE